jgi:CxxC motif-containing protein
MTQWLNDKMAQSDTLICITCPMGCALAVVHEGQTVTSVTGNHCKRGPGYAQAELSDPRRMVATTVRARGGARPLLPVYTAAPFPKGRIFELLAALRGVDVAAPMRADQVVLADALGTGIDVLASCDMEPAGG